MQRAQLRGTVLKQDFQNSEQLCSKSGNTGGASFRFTELVALLADEHQFCTLVCSSLLLPDGSSAQCEFPTAASVVLQMHSVQTAVLDAVIEGLSTFGESLTSAQVNYALATLRSLHFVNSVSSLLSSLQLHLPVMPAPLQEGCITLLPQLANDVTAMDAAAELLKSHLSSSPDAVRAVLDACQALCLPPPLLREMLSDVQLLLQTLPPAALPAVIAFTLDSMHALQDDVAHVHSSKRLRSHPPSSSAAPPPSNEDAAFVQPPHGDGHMTQSGALRMVLQCIKQAVAVKQAAPSAAAPAVPGHHGDTDASCLAMCLLQVHTAIARNVSAAGEWSATWHACCSSAADAVSAHVAVLALWCAVAALYEHGERPAAAQSALLATRVLAELPIQQMKAEVDTCVQAITLASADSCRRVLKALLLLLEGGGAGKRRGGQGTRAVVLKMREVVMIQLCALLRASKAHCSGLETLDAVVFALLRGAVTGGACTQAACVECLIRVASGRGGVAMLGRYWEHVINILDHCSQLSPPYVHGLYTLLLLLQVAPDASLHHELSVLIQKQLHSSDPAYLVCGVFGALAQLRWAAWAPLIPVLGAAPPDTAEAYSAGTQSAFSAEEPSAALQQLLSGALEQLQDRVDAAGLFLSTLASLVRGLSQQVQQAPAAEHASQAEQQAVGESLLQQVGAQQVDAHTAVQRAFCGWGVQQLRLYGGGGASALPGGLGGTEVESWTTAPALPFAALPVLFSFLSNMWECSSLVPAVPAVGDGEHSLAPPSTPPSAVRYPTALCAISSSGDQEAPLVLRLPSICAVSSGQADEPNGNKPFVRAGLLLPLLSATTSCAEQRTGDILQVADFFHCAVELPESMAEWTACWEGGTRPPPHMAEHWEALRGMQAPIAAHVLATGVLAGNWWRFLLNTFAMGVVQCSGSQEQHALRQRAVQLYLCIQGVEAWLLSAVACCDGATLAATERLLTPLCGLQALQGGFAGAIGFKPLPVAGNHTLPPWHGVGDDSGCPAPDESLGPLLHFVAPLTPPAAAMLLSFPPTCWPERCTRTGAPEQDISQSTVSPRLLCGLMPCIAACDKLGSLSAVTLRAAMQVLAGPEHPHVPDGDAGQDDASAASDSPAAWAAACFTLLHDSAQVSTLHAGSKSVAEETYGAISGFLRWLVTCMLKLQGDHEQLVDALTQVLATGLAQSAGGNTSGHPSPIAKALRDVREQGSAFTWTQHGSLVLQEVFLFLLRQLEGCESPALLLAASGTAEALLAALGQVKGGKGGHKVPELGAELSTACEDILRTPPAEDCKWRPTQVASVMRVWLQHAPRPAQCISQACKETMLPLMGPAGTSGHLSLLSPRDIPAAIKALCTAAAQGVVQLQPPPLDKFMTEGPAFLVSATSAVGAFKHVVALSKREAPPCPPVALTAMLRGGAACLTAAKAWAPLLSKLLALDTKAVVALLKHMQSSGRQLHAIAAHLQTKGVSTAAAATAAFKRRQEEWLFAVKRVLAEAGLGDAFWMGNLKSKDLQGAALSSQLAADVPPPTPPSEDEEDNAASHGGASDDDDDDQAAASPEM